MLFDVQKLKRTLDYYYRNSTHFRSVIKVTPEESRWVNEYKIIYYYKNSNELNVNDIISVANGLFDRFNKKTFTLKRITSKYVKKHGRTQNTR